MENKSVNRYEDLKQRAGNEDFDCIRVIGKGSYGEVWLAKHKKDKKQYVLKKMNLGKASKRERKSAEQEAKLLSKLKHPNIVSYKDSFESDGFLYIAMQYCEGGDLYARLKEQKGVPLDERQVVEWFVQIAMALQYMHERNILHRDLKTQNIFLTKSKIIKVGDLGIARILDNASSMATTLIGTPYYMSPELFSNKPYNHKSDVWALGCCVYEMTTLKHAFNAKDINSLVYKILKGRMPPMPCQYSSELLILMRSMLHQDPEKRPSVNRILRDPYIKKNIAIFLEDTKRNNRQINQSSSRLIAASASRPSSASGSRKDSASSLAESVSHVENILKSDMQKLEGDIKVITEKTKENIKSFSGGDVQETPQTLKEIHSPKKESAPRKKNFLRNHVKNNKTEQTESELSIEEREKGHDLGKPPLGQAKDNEKIVSLPEVKGIKTEQSELKAHDRDWQKTGPDLKNSVSSQAKNNDKGAQELQIPSPKKEGAPRKKNVLWDHIRSSKAEKAEMEVPSLEKPPLFQAKNSEETDLSLEHQRNENKTRPLPVPRVKASAGLPQHREDRIVSAEFSRSSSVSSSTEDRDTPRSLPNLSARQRRRQQKNDFAGSKENSSSARIKLRRVPERAESDKITKTEKRDLQVEEFVSQSAAGQPSTCDSTSSDDSQKVTGKESTKDTEAERENKEMNNFICLLDSTLQMNSVTENSEEEEEELVPVKGGSINSKPSSHLTQLPEQPSKDHFHKSVSMPSIETLTDTSRLMHRIRMLHTDCVRGVGFDALKKAFEILNKIDEDEVEPKLVDLLGKNKFDEYAGKIWQLKFCEESLFETP